MPTSDIEQLTRILQLSITPIALISGVGLLLLSMTNRLGRVIDRSRDLGAAVEPGQARADSPAIVELGILLKRARLLLAAIALITTSMFLAVLVVGALFAMNFLTASLNTLILLLFGLCLLCLVAATGCFLGDIFLSIRWLRVSLGQHFVRH